MPEVLKKIAFSAVVAALFKNHQPELRIVSKSNGPVFLCVLR